MLYVIQYSAYLKMLKITILCLRVPGDSHLYQQQPHELHKYYSNECTDIPLFTQHLSWQLFAKFYSTQWSHSLS